ncbi:MAG: DUF2621 family protein [Candidatus Omnitrophota bacterium]
MSDITWDEVTKRKFDLMISKMPLFHRKVAESLVSGKAIKLAQERNSSIVEEQDVVKAFFNDVPKPFEAMMIKVMEEAGFDYKKYGFGISK